MSNRSFVPAFARMGTPCWWLLLVQGGAEFVLGALARGDHVRSLFLFINSAGAFCVSREVYGIFAAFELP